MARDDDRARIIDAHFGRMTQDLRSNEDWLEGVNERSSAPALEPGKPRLMIRVRVCSSDGEYRFTTGDMPDAG